MNYTYSNVMKVLFSRYCLIVAILLICGAGTATSGFVDLARSGQWAELLRVAQLRADQLPLNPGESLVAATAARNEENTGAQKKFLRQAATDPDFTQFAQVELARVIVQAEPDQAVALILLTLRNAQTPQLRKAALEVLELSVASGIESSTSTEIRRLKRRGSRSQRRRLQLIQANTDPKNQRVRLASLIENGSGDLEALEAARLLMTEDLNYREMWLAGKALYRHALYSQAEPLFEALTAANSTAVPLWEVAFLRARCAFRGERFDEAIDWYQKAKRRTTSSERRANILVHIGRCQELNGTLETAIESARAAVLSKTNDDRRLFLARLRLRNNQPDLANKGISQIRGRSARSRGNLMVALYELEQGNLSNSLQSLKKVIRKPWRGPAALITASIKIEGQDWDEAIRQLDLHAAELDPFWAGYARELLGSIPEETIKIWRKQSETKITTETGNSRKRQLRRWTNLEIEPQHWARVRTLIDQEIDLKPAKPDPPFNHHLAGRLWSLGLESDAVHSNPGNMPNANPRETLWTAQRFLEYNAPDRAIRSTYNAWRNSAGWLSMRALPDTMRSSYHPLPYKDFVLAAAKKHNVPWNLLAGVAREESKWNADVLSRVGARGLLQLMPKTARATAARIGNEEPHEDDLFDPGLSLELGAAELGRLLKHYNGRAAMTVAAYNAGQRQVDLWLDQCGNGCSTETFILNISFKATRGYTADVLASARTYAELYNPDVETTTAADKGVTN